MIKTAILSILALVSTALAPKTFDAPLRHVVGTLLWFESPEAVEIADVLDLDAQVYARTGAFQMRGDAQVACIKGIFDKPVTVYTSSGSGRHLARWTMVLNALLYLRAQAPALAFSDVINFEWITVASNGGDVVVSFRVTRKRGESDKKFINRAVKKYTLWTSVFPPKVKR